jgi:hypothetical protein
LDVVSFLLKSHSRGAALFVLMAGATEAFTEDPQFFPGVFYIALQRNGKLVTSGHFPEFLLGIYRAFSNQLVGRTT